MLGLGGGMALSGAKSRPFNEFSLHFDGDGDYLNTNYAFQVVMRASFTISCWLKPTDGQPSSNEVIFGMASYDDNNQFQIILNSDGTMSCKFHANSDSVTSTTDNVFWNDGQETWKHIVWVVKENEDDDTEFFCYLNGNLRPTTPSRALTDTNQSAFTNSAAFFWGGLNDIDSGGNNVLVSPYTGLIDEAAFIVTYLDATKVGYIYNLGVPFDITRPKSETGTLWQDEDEVMALWRMGDNDYITGASITALPGEGNDAVLASATIVNATFSTDVP